jgi:ABC-2 type transport system ATP-binding protein
MTAVRGNPNALEALDLGKRYRQHWALRHCSFRIPSGAICGVVGSNGAGKSTLLDLAAALQKPTEGSIRLFGRGPGDPESRRRVGFVAQDKPLYSRFTLNETLRLGRELNPGWNEATATLIIEHAGLDRSVRVGALSGGQRACVALALALAKRPEMLLLDEPMSEMDPLARRQLMGTLMAEAAEHGTTIVMSSHIVAELDGAIDHLLLVDAGNLQLAGSIDDITAAHRIVVGSGGIDALAAHTIVETRRTGRQITAVIRADGGTPIGWQAHVPNLDDLLLAYMREPQAFPLITEAATPWQ